MWRTFPASHSAMPPLDMACSVLLFFSEVQPEDCSLHKTVHMDNIRVFCDWILHAQKIIFKYRDSVLNLFMNFYKFVLYWIYVFCIWIKDLLCASVCIRKMHCSRKDKNWDIQEAYFRGSRFKEAFFLIVLHFCSPYII